MSGRAARRGKPGSQTAKVILSGPGQGKRLNPDKGDREEKNKKPGIEFGLQDDTGCFPVKPDSPCSADF